MKKTFLCFTLTIFVFSVLCANSVNSATSVQNTLLNDYKASFFKGNIDDKISLLNSVLTPNFDTEIALQVINDCAAFVIDYSPYLKDDSSMVSLASKTVESFSKLNQESALNYLILIFEKYDSISVKKAVLETMCATGYKDSRLIERIKNFALSLDSEAIKNDDFMLLLIDTMAKTEENSFFDILFTVAANDFFSDVVSNAAKTAINNFATGYKDNMIRIIENNPIEEKYVALDLAMKNSKNSDFLRAELAEKALSTTIINIDNVNSVCKEYVQFQLMAVRELRRVGWTRSVDLIVSYYKVAKSEYEKELLTQQEFIEVIECLTEMAASKAGTVLTDYLGYFNSQTELGNVCSEPLVLAVIQALGSLGDKIAFDNLLFACYLPYSEEIKEAARMALAGLKF